MSPSPLRVKKYSNRRLYDTEISAYITLTELADRIRAGRQVTVEDAKTGTDLTRQILLQVILEEQERLDMLPPEMLHHIIRAQGTLQAAPLSSYLAESWERYAGLGEAAAKQAGELLGALGGGSPYAAWMKATQAAQTAWTARDSAGSYATHNAAAPPPPDDPEPEPAKPTDKATAEAVADSVEALRQQMDELLGRLKGG